MRILCGGFECLGDVAQTRFLDRIAQRFTERAIERFGSVLLDNRALRIQHQGGLLFERAMAATEDRDQQDQHHEQEDRVHDQSSREIDGVEESAEEAADGAFLGCVHGRIR